MPNLNDINKRLAKAIGVGNDTVDRLLVSFEKQLTKNYRAALSEIKNDIARMYEKYGDSVKYSDMAAYNRLVNLENQIAAIINKLTKSNISTTKKAIKTLFSQAYYMTGYAFESTVKLNLGFGLLNENVIAASILNQYDRITWPMRLKNSANIYNRQLKETLTQGLIQGHGYAKMARAFNDRTNIDYGRAVRIMRTEGGRAQSAATVLAFEKFEQSSDFKTKRVWLATLDGRTRDTHRSMDMQKADKDGMFTLPSGVKTEGPRLSGIAEEDINCRCTTIVEFEDMPQQSRKDNIDKNIIHIKNYAEWAAAKGINPAE